MTETTNGQAATENKGPQKAPATFRAILGEKLGMTQIFHPKDNNLYDVTIVKAGPCSILRVKTADSSDGYNAVQLGFGSRPEKSCSKSELGQFKKAGVPPQKHVREIRVKSIDGLAAGQTIALDVAFKSGDYVDVQGVTKGHGFAGVIKRHGFLGLPASHGASDKERSPGSLAARRSLGRVLPGQRMAGRMGHETTSTMKIEVVKVDPAENLLYVAGPVPGPRGCLVVVAETVKSKKFRAEAAKAAVRKDKMGNIIKPGAAKGGAKK